MATPILPVITNLNRPFWEGCAAGELRLQACRPDGHLRYPLSEICPLCLSPAYEWQRVSGLGEILSAVTVCLAYDPAWENLVPYNVVLVQLTEGPRMFSNVLPLDRRGLRAGTPVRVVFQSIAEGLAIPRFVPVAE